VEKIFKESINKRLIIVSAENKHVNAFGKVSVREGLFGVVWGGFHLIVDGSVPVLHERQSGQF
jgi:hypothetical protein